MSGKTSGTFNFFCRKTKTVLQIPTSPFLIGSFLALGFHKPTIIAFSFSENIIQHHAEVLNTMPNTLVLMTFTF